MAATATTYVYLKPKPGSYYTQLFVLGRIPTWVIHSGHSGEDGMSVEELAENWEIPVEAVREAIAYCESNPPEMQVDRRREEALMEASGMNDPNYKWNPHPKFLPPEELHRILTT
ncbi:MAG: hypothetical protein NTW87_30190 [Planctomycetota bacterium]|nr:hypothetical protein [Planctomycetota bacterium]